MAPGVVAYGPGGGVVYKALWASAAWRCLRHLVTIRFRFSGSWWAETLCCPGRRPFWEQTGAVRDVRGIMVWDWAENKRAGVTAQAETRGHKQPAWGSGGSLVPFRLGPGLGWGQSRQQKL